MQILKLDISDIEKLHLQAVKHLGKLIIHT